MNLDQKNTIDNSYFDTDRLLFLANLIINSNDSSLNQTINGTYFKEENNNSKLSNLSDDQIFILRLISKILCSFSIAGLLFVLLMFVFFRSVRSFVLELAVWLCATNLFFNLNVYFPIGNTKNNWCVTQGLISTFSDLSTMIWTTIIGFFSYFSVVKSGFIDKNKRNLRLCFILVAYFIPGIFTLILSINEKFGPAGLWCWIEEGDNKYYQIAYYCITWIVVMLNTIFVTLLIWNLRQLNCNDDMIGRYINKLKLYPLIQIISLVPATINRINSLIGNPDYFWMMIIQVIFDSLTGLIFSVVYGFNPNVRTIVYDFFQGFCTKKPNEEEMNNNLDDSVSIDHPNRFRSDSIKMYDDNIITGQHEHN